MVDDRSIVEQTHDVQTLENELENFEYALLVKFVVGCIISKFSQAWTSFATSLKHKRRESSVHVVHKPHNSYNPTKKKNKQEHKQKPITTFRKKNKKENHNYCTFGKPEHFANEYPDSKWKA